MYYLYIPVCVTQKSQFIQIGIVMATFSLYYEESDVAKYEADLLVLVPKFYLKKTLNTILPAS